MKDVRAVVGTNAFYRVCHGKILASEAMRLAPYPRKMRSIFRGYFGQRVVTTFDSVKK